MPRIISLYYLCSGKQTVYNALVYTHVQRMIGTFHIIRLFLKTQNTQYSYMRFFCCPVYMYYHAVIVIYVENNGRTL